MSAAKTLEEIAEELADEAGEWSAEAFTRRIEQALQSVRDAAFMEGWDAAVGECNRVGGEKALQFMKANREAARGALAVADAVFALKGKR